jgi:hypothetical protein
MEGELDRLDWWSDNLPKTPENVEAQVERAILKTAEDRLKLFDSLREVSEHYAGEFEGYKMPSMPAAHQLARSFVRGIELRVLPFEDPSDPAVDELFKIACRAAQIPAKSPFAYYARLPD